MAMNKGAQQNQNQNSDLADLEKTISKIKKLKQQQEP
jgi:hypothetical protein